MPDAPRSAEPAEEREDLWHWDTDRARRELLECAKSDPDNLPTLADRLILCVARNTTKRLRALASSPPAGTRETAEEIRVGPSQSQCGNCFARADDFGEIHHRFASCAALSGSAPQESAGKAVAFVPMDGDGDYYFPQSRPTKDAATSAMSKLRGYNDGFEFVLVPLFTSLPASAEDAKRIEQMRRAISWACGAEDGFEPPPGVRSPFWWRSELCARAGLEWDGTAYTFVAARAASQSGSDR